MSFQQPLVQERETEQIVGTVTGIVQKGADKWQAVVQPDGSQYTKNLWTKDEQLIVSLSRMIGQRLGFACNVSHWNMQDGTPVRSLWIDAVGAVAPGSPAMQGPPTTTMQQPITGAMQTAPNVLPQVQVQQQIPQEVKEARIHRQTASKVAAILLTHLQPEQRTMDTLLVLSERLCRYYENGLPHPQTVEDLINQAMPQGMDDFPPPDPGQYTGDDDIPF